MLNSYLLFNKINTNKKQNYVEYRIKIAKLLIKNISLLEYKRKERLSNEDLPEKLHANHFSKQIDPTPSKSKPARSCKNIAKQCESAKHALYVLITFEKYDLRLLNFSTFYQDINNNLKYVFI